MTLDSDDWRKAAARPAYQYRVRLRNRDEFNMFFLPQPKAISCPISWPTTTQLIAFGSLAVGCTPGKARIGPHATSMSNILVGSINANKGDGEKL